MYPVKQPLKIAAAIATTLLVVEIINLLTQRSLVYFGIYPRNLHYLPMIFTSPFIHASVQHLLANLITVSVFAGLISTQGTKRFLTVSLWIIVVTGLLVWLLGRSAMHVGASGVIYGYLGYLLIAGWRSKQKRMLLISLLVAAFYGSMIFGVLPSAGFISWESHLFGFFSGVIAAWYWAK
ncbi:rhomboid family intramembrane serine protease [Alteromonas facilis]|uniref:rhomboid family intramembrane serine protease n=1 Tax=Alteromonas facilis TaxID=2048004 RepID=UPI000C2899FA|nr:rhomboid family intramembrane serine protease [Alteromonas facilis]